MRNAAAAATAQNDHATKLRYRGWCNTLNSPMNAEKTVESHTITVEFAVLKNNPNIKSITAIDPRTGVATVLWKK
jgi:hypothetical protein